MEQRKPANISEISDPFGEVKSREQENKSIEMVHKYM
jgi:hypothetical protein